MPLFSLLSWRCAGVVALITFGGIVYAEMRRIADLELKLEAATSLANANAEVAMRERAFRQKAEKIVDQNAIAAERARKKYRIQRQEIADAKHQDDAPLAPVLRHILDSLPKSEDPQSVD